MLLWFCLVVAFAVVCLNLLFSCWCLLIAFACRLGYELVGLVYIGCFAMWLLVLFVGLRCFVAGWFGVVVLYVFFRCFTVNSVGMIFLFINNYLLVIVVFLLDVSGLG